MKKATLLLFVLLGVSLFAADAPEGTLFDENLPSHSEKVGGSLEFKPRVGVAWEYDLQNNQSGFTELIDLDLVWEIAPYKDHITDSSDVEWGNPYGVTMFSGGHLLMKIENVPGGMNASDGEGDYTMEPVFSLNYERLWGKIVFDPFYLLVAANSHNHYNRVTGFSFAAANNMPRADWAHLGYRVQKWAGAVNNVSDFYTIGGNANTVSASSANEGALGLGFITGPTEIFAQVSSKQMQSNPDNEYEASLAVESNPVGNLILKASVFGGINYATYSDMPLALSFDMGYRFDLSQALAFVPHTAMDVRFVGTNDAPFSETETENVVGLSLDWPGTSGWGDNPLADAESNVFSGISVEASITNRPSFDVPVINLVASMHEDTSGGLIPNLGTTWVYEMANIQDSDKLKNTYGVYLDYNIWDQYKPYTRIKKVQDSPIYKEVAGEFGLEITTIPSTVFKLIYESPDISKLSDNKGVFTSEIWVTF